MNCRPCFEGGGRRRFAGPGDTRLPRSMTVWVNYVAEPPKTYAGAEVACKAKELLPRHPVTKSRLIGGCGQSHRAETLREIPSSLPNVQAIGMVRLALAANL